jgi:ubiquinone/menaquinone biosynthesis C-methylase UbiE
MPVEENVASHYTRGNLEQAILAAIATTRPGSAKLSTGDLVALDEFHVGGIEATRELADQMQLSHGMRVLDVGCGIGGPARYFAEDRRCHVTGVDLTKEFVDVARRLTQMVGLSGTTEFHQADARTLSFANASFDRAYMIHVGMNIADKTAVYREVGRVLKPDGIFAVFDVVRASDGEISYPMPWANSAETSFVSDLNQYHHALEASGFKIERQRHRGQFSIEFTERAMARTAQSGPPALGLQLLMGEKTPLMLKNVLIGMKQGVLEPIEILARAV